MLISTLLYRNGMKHNNISGISYMLISTLLYRNGMKHNIHMQPEKDGFENYICRTRRGL